MFFVLAVRRRQRDDPQPHRPLDARADRASRGQAELVADIDDDVAVGHGDRGVPPLGQLDPQLPPHRHARHRDRAAMPIAAGRQGRHLLPVGQPRRGRCSTTRTASTSGRTPNDHLTFGGGGAHFCLGANLARAEIKVMMREFLRRYPNPSWPASRAACAPTSSTASSCCRPLHCRPARARAGMSDVRRPPEKRMQTDLATPTRHRVPDLRLHPLPRRRRRR